MVPLVPVIRCALTRLTIRGTRGDVPQNAAGRDDGPLPLARRRLSDALHALADPIPEWAGGTCRWSDALYVRLRAELPGGTRARRGWVNSSRLPCRGDVLDLLFQIDTTVGGWEPHGKGTVERLHELAGRGWLSR